MLRTIERMRGFIYPRANLLDRREPDYPHGSDILLGMLSVMLAVLVIAEGITLGSAF